MSRIYLSGNISSNRETYRWREQATELLRVKHCVLDPAANHFNRRLLKEAQGDAESFFERAVTRSQGILIAKDFQLIGSADIVLVNLQLITPEKPPIGTLYELAWSWMLKKPVIAIVGNNIYCKHPFTVSTFSATAETVEEACKIINEFFME